MSRHPAKVDPPSSQEPCLYLVPTPIGNLSDMTPRALGILSSVDFILAEDTRVSNKLLMHFRIDNNLRSFHSQNEHKTWPLIVDQLRQGKRIALVTDAGTPGISDPAYLLVRACREAEIPVVALPGATAFVPALVASGLPCDKFFFNGFLPHRKGRKSQIEWLAQLPSTVVLYESPHRIKRCAAELLESFGNDRNACFAKEISKLHETYFTGALGDIVQALQTANLSGEWVIVLAGNPESTY